MSHFDLGINELEKKIILLEEQKQAEREKEFQKISNPLNILKYIIDEKRKQIEQNVYSTSVPLAKFNDQKKLAVLEPIVNMFKNIEDRLDKLEKKN